MASSIPNEPPPTYTEASSSAAPAGPPPSHHTAGASNLEVPSSRNGISQQDRRSMEDEGRELPSGWVRQYDSTSHHQFFVDTRASPPRSIWHHPYDDETYLSSLPSAERERIVNHPHHSMVHDDGHSSADERDPKLPPREEKKGLGRKIKDKLTSSTHEEREAARRQRDEEEAAAYRRHQHIRQQMSKAMQTGEPQLLGKDKNGKDVYIEPPTGMGGYGSGGYGYNPYSQGPYSAPNSRYIRPQQPYGRPYPGYGYGYGGGYGGRGYGGYGGGFGGAPLLGLGGGLLLGGLLF